MGRLLKKKNNIRKKALERKQDNETSNLISDSGRISARESLSRSDTGRSHVTATGVRKKKSPSAGPVSFITKGYTGKAIQFLREVKAELRKVTWPSHRQARGSTLVVIILVIIISLFLGAADFGLSGMIRLVLG